MKNFFFAILAFLLSFPFISNAQNVGIGTNTPRAKLEVNGGIRVDSVKPASSQSVSALVIDSAGNFLKQAATDPLANVASICVNGGFGGNTGYSPPQMYTDDPTARALTAPNNYFFYFQKQGTYNRDVDVSSVLQLITSVVVLNGFVYVLGQNSSSQCKVLRFSSNDITQPYTVMAFTGKALGANSSSFPMMTVDSGKFYFSYDGNNNSHDNLIAKYTLSGNTFTYVKTLTVGSQHDMNMFLVIDGNYYGFATDYDMTMKKFNKSATLLYTSGDFDIRIGATKLFQSGKNIFMGTSGEGDCLNRIWYQ